MPIRYSLLFLILPLMLVNACSREHQGEMENPEAVLDLPQQAPATRLPDGIAPSRYRIKLAIDPREDDFSGEVEVDITLAASANLIWMHGNNLEVTNAEAVLADGQRIALAWEQVESFGVARVTPEEPLPAGSATLVFSYHAPFNTSLEGLYKVNQGDDSYAYTQFEATSARLAFPSFDEPAFKVPFDVSLTVPNEFTGIANGPLVKETPAADGQKNLQFATTPPLPTYLIAFAVGPFDIVEWTPVPASALRPEPLPLRGITTRGKGEQIRFALENTAPILLEMEDYFAAPHPYAKLDLIAVPDFGSGAMENAGAITYREQLILMDEGASVNQKRSFFYVHAHELAHQWFGNLVTPVWWDDIWLNESFATWNAYTILDRLYPEEKYRDSLQNSSAQVMSNDGLASARPIREPIKRHEDIGSAFNGITYQKGGGVLTMFESFLGSEGFREGIRHYMAKFALGNTTAEDFIGAIADANPQVNGDDLRAAFSSFIEQPGLPELSVSVDCSNAVPALEISQQRFLPAGSTGSTDSSWLIPACVTTYAESGARSQCFLVEEREQRFELNSERCPHSLLPNTGGASYYRWTLPPEQWATLMQRFDGMETAEQLSVAGNLSAALHADKLPLEDYLEAAATITRSDSWRVALVPRADVYTLLENSDNPAFKQRLRDLLEQWYAPALEQLDQVDTLRTDQIQFRSLLRSTLALGAENVKQREELANVAARYTGFRSDRQLHPELVDSNLIYISLLVASDDLGPDFRELMWQLFNASDDAQVRERLLSALAYSKDPATAKRLHSTILSAELKDNEIFYILWNQANRRENQAGIWNWTRDNLDGVLARIPTWRKGQLPAVFNEFCSTEKAASIEQTFNPIIDSLESGPRYLANTLESIRLCATFLELHAR